MKKLIIAFVLLAGCSTTQKIQTIYSKPPVSGNYLVIDKEGHVATLKNFDRKIDIPADQDTVKIGDIIKVVVVSGHKKAFVVAGK